MSIKTEISISSLGREGGREGKRGKEREGKRGKEREGKGGRERGGRNRSKK